MKLIEKDKHGEKHKHVSEQLLNEEWSLIWVWENLAYNISYFMLNFDNIELFILINYQLV